MLSDKRVWNQIVNLANTDYPLDNNKKINAELECVKNNTVCIPGEYSLTILDQNGKIYFDSLNKSLGYNNKGDFCNSFNEDLEDKNCPYQVKIKWKPICPLTGVCQNPQIQIFAQTVVSNNSLINLSNSTVASMAIERPVTFPPVIKTNSVYTNASFEPGDHDVNYDVSADVTTFNISNVWKLSLDPSMTTSLRGGAVTLNNSTYTSVGTLYVKVMTGYTWIGATNDVWSVRTNWCGSVAADKKSCIGAGGAPVNTSLAILDATCTTINCNPIITSSISVGGIEISAHSLKQMNGYQITVGNKNFKILSGSFIGGNRNMTLNSDFLLSGGNYTATSASTILNRTLTISGNPIFNANGGTFNFNYDSSYTLKPGNIDFNDVSFGDANGLVTISGGDLKVRGNLEFKSSWVAIPKYTGVIQVYGNVSASNKGMWGTGLVKLVGSSNQLISTSGTANLPGGNIIVNKTGGSVILKSNISLLHAGQSLVVNKGSIAMSGYELAIANALELDIKSGGDLIVNGTSVSSGPYNNGVINP